MRNSKVTFKSPEIGEEWTNKSKEKEFKRISKLFEYFVGIDSSLTRTNLERRINISIRN